MGDKSFTGPLHKVDDCCYRIPRSYREDMRVDGMIFASDKMIEAIRSDQAPEQVANVACLPGIQGASLAMPDIHWGYGFCIGGVCATDPAEGGVISPGGVGYDINCGVRLMRSNVHQGEISTHLRSLVEELFRRIPAGVGRSGPFRFGKKELSRLMRDGTEYLYDRDLATDRDLALTEASGCLEGADPKAVSGRAFERGASQCGTLGSGNHFVELQIVDRIVNAKAAEAFGLFEGQLCVMIHSGSRGLGYQVCDDSLRSLRKAPAKYGLHLPDRQLACAPVDSPEGEAYIAAMRSAANYAWCNRQLLMHQAREAFEHVLGQRADKLELEQVYDVAHNIAKLESHTVEGQQKSVWVHRKGATRAFPAGHPEVPERYREVGQPVLIPGDMGTASWVLIGGERAMERSFGTTCHGAGRVMSRKAAMRSARGRRIDEELLEKGVIARAASLRGLAEEQPDAYKNVDDVVDVVHQAGLSSKVARLRPVGVVKG
jgi:tRNA-splicing ligase RtcB